MHPKHIHFPVPPDAYDSLQNKSRRRKIPSLVCVAYILAGAWANRQWPALLRKQSSFPPTAQPETISREELHSSFAITSFKSLFNGFMSRLFLSFFFFY